MALSNVQAQGTYQNTAAMQQAGKTKRRVLGGCVSYSDAMKAAGQADAENAANKADAGKAPISLAKDALFTYANPTTGESVGIYRADEYTEDAPLYIVKGTDADGKAFEQKIHAWTIRPHDCSYNELMILHAETGHVSVDDYLTAAIARGKAGVPSYAERADYFAAAQKGKDDYRNEGRFEEYLAIDKWMQEIKEYTEVPVYFDRAIMERNKAGACSFAKVKTAEQLQQEIEDTINANRKKLPTLREVLASTYPNAVNMTYSFVGSNKQMTFDEYVRATEEMLRRLQENAELQK